jgi:hypothetical protein
MAIHRHLSPVNYQTSTALIGKNGCAGWLDRPRDRR